MRQRRSRDACVVASPCRRLASDCATTRRREKKVFILKAVALWFEYLERKLAASPMLDTLGIEADEVSAALNDHERLHDLLSARSASFEQVIHCASDLNAWQT
jgi:hypothetical protein